MIKTGISLPSTSGEFQSRDKEDRAVQDSRDWIVRCVWMAGVLMLGCAVFGSLWSGLAGLGDAGGARFFQGMFWGFFACWCLNGTALVGLLTAHILNPSKIPMESKDN
jgi:hypothetical protein